MAQGRVVMAMLPRIGGTPIHVPPIHVLTFRVPAIRVEVAPSRARIMAEPTPIYDQLVRDRDADFFASHERATIKPFDAAASQGDIPCLQHLPCIGI